MATKPRSALRAGLLMLGSVALIVFVVISIKGLGWIKDPSETHVVAFDLKTDIGGLRVGDEVRVGGFKVGEVRDIALRTRDDDPQRGPYLVVAYTMPRRYAVHDDARLRIGGTVTGTSWLNFEDLGRGKPLAPGQPLVGLPGTMSELLAGAGEVETRLSSILKQVDEKAVPAVTAALADIREKTVPKVNDTVDKFAKTADSFKKAGDDASALVTDVRASYKPIVEKYDAVAQKAVEMLEAVRALFGDTTEDFRTTVANLRKATGDLSDKLPGMLAKADSALAKIDEGAGKLGKSLEALETTLASAKEFADGAKSLVVQNRSRIDDMVDSLKKSADNLKGATAEIRRSPWRLLYQPTPEEVQNLNVYDTARQFAEGANDLNDAAAALRDALKDHRVSDEQLKALLDRLDQTFGHFRDVEQQLWKKVKE